MGGDRTNDRRTALGWPRAAGSYPSGSPRLMDLVALVAVFATQRTDEPKGRGAPDNLEAPREDVRSARGHFGRTRARSAWTRFEMRRARPLEAVYAALAGVAAPLGRRLAKDGAGPG